MSDDQQGMCVTEDQFAIYIGEGHTLAPVAAKIATTFYPLQAASSLSARMRCPRGMTLVREGEVYAVVGWRLDMSSSRGVYFEYGPLAYADNPHEVRGIAWEVYDENALAGFNLIKRMLRLDA